MVAARQLEPNPFLAAEDLRKHVIRLMQTTGEETRGNILVLPQVFLEFLDYDHKRALFLNKLLYWTERTKNADKWVYKSYKDWYAELGFKESVIRRLIYGDASTKTRKRTLTDIGVEVKVKRAPNGSPTCHYRINLDVFLDAVRRFGDEKQQGDSHPELGNFPTRNPGDPQDRKPESQDFDPTASAASSDQVTTAPTSSENTSTESSGSTRCDEEDLDILRAFTGRFGKLKAVHERPIRDELARLGAERVGEVLKRCATRGRSWNYVLRALANETGAPRVSAAVTEAYWGAALAAQAVDGRAQSSAMGTAPLVVSERLEMAWEVPEQASRSLHEVWSAALHQFEMQIGSEYTLWGRDLTLVDYEPNTATFVAVARSEAARDMLQKRLYRTLRRILSDVGGHPVELRFLLADEWREQGRLRQQVA